MVRALDRALRDQGRQAWVDWDSIHPSAEWATEIERGIRCAASFLFVVSPDSVVSDVCLRELATAVDLNKRIIPIICREVSHQDAPVEIAKRQWIFMRQQDDIASAMSELAKALDVDIQWLHRHNALLGQALAWQDADQETSRLLKGSALRQAETWLAEAAGKEPPPAQAHISFVQTSRQRATKLLRRIATGAVAGMLLAIGLTIWAAIASFAAQAARDVAIARQLNIEADLAGSERGELIERSALLAIESYYLNPLKDAVSDIPLRRALSLLGKATARWEYPNMPIIDATFLGAGGSGADDTNEAHRVAFAVDNPAGSLVVLPESADVITIEKIRQLQSCAGGQTLTVRSDANGVELYDPETGNRKTQLTRLSSSTKVLCDDPSSTLLVGWQDGKVSVHDAATGEHYHDMATGLGAPVRSLAVDADRQLVAAGSFHPDSYRSNCPPLAERSAAAGLVNKLMIWSLASGEMLASSPHCRPVEAIDFDPHGGRLATASGSWVHFWSLTDGSLQGTLGHRTNVRSVDFSPNDALLVAGSGNSAHVWNTYNEVLVEQLLHEGPVSAAQFSPGGSLILTASNDHTSRLWRAGDGRELLRFPHYRDRVLLGDNPYMTQSAFSADGEQILTAARDGRVRVWAHTLPAQFELVSASTIDIPVRTNNPNVRVWSTSGRYYSQRISSMDWELRRMPGNQAVLSFTSDHPLLAIAVSDDKRRLAASTFGGDILVLDLIQEDLAQTLSLGCDASANRQSPFEQCFASTLSFDSSGEKLLSGSRNGVARYWSLDSGKLLWEQQDQGIMIMSSAVSPVDNFVATGGTDGQARVRHIEDGKMVMEFSHSHDVKDLAFSPDGNQLASASSDTTARLFDISGEETTLYLQHRYPVESVSYSPSGDRVVTASTDSTVRVWNVQSSDEVSRIELKNPAVHASFINDGEILSVDTGQASVHRVGMQALIEQACERLTRNLEPLEWLQATGLGAQPRATCPGLPAPAMP